MNELDWVNGLDNDGDSSWKGMSRDEGKVMKIYEKWIFIARQTLNTQLYGKCVFNENIKDFSIVW